MTNHTRKWIRGGLELLIHGFTGACIASGVAYFVDSKDWALWGQNFWKMFGGVFWTQGGVRFLQYWNNNPLPPEETDPGMGEPQRMGLNPLSKVVPAPSPAPPPA